MRTTVSLLALAGLALGAEEAPDLDAMVFDAQQYAMEVAIRIEALEAALRQASGSRAASFLVLLEDPEADIRLTALQWLARRPETAYQALSAALTDESSVIREAALSILRDRGLESADLQELREAMEQQDRPSVERLLLRIPPPE